MLDGVYGRGVAGLALPGLVHRNDTELDLALLCNPGQPHLQRLVARGRGQRVGLLPVLAHVALLYDVAGDGAAAVAGRGRPPDVGPVHVVVCDLGGARLAGLI